MKDVLLQGDDISNFEESTVNDDELQVYYQEGSDCFSNGAFHLPTDDAFHGDLKHEISPSTSESFALNEMISYPSDRKDWVRFEDETQSEVLNDSDLDVLEEEWEGEKRPQLSEDDVLLQSGQQDKKRNLVLQNDEAQGKNSPPLPPLHFSAILTSQFPN